VEKSSQQAARPPGCAEKVFPKGRGSKLDVFDSCYIYVGGFSIRQKWLNREVSESLTAVVLVGVAGMSILLGFILGWMVAKERYYYICMDF
jgi:hypothetical protein